MWERRLPSTSSKDEEEKRLGQALIAIRSTKIKKYEGQKISSIGNEEDRRILGIIEILDREYGLGQSLKNALEIENWCKEHNSRKPIWERRLLNRFSKDKEEKRLGQALCNIRNKIKKYEGQEISKI